VNIRRLWVKLALLFVMAAAIGFALPTTLAYLTAKSDTIVNTFTAPYFPAEQTSVDVYVHKTVRNIGTERIGPEGFRFVLQNTQSGESHVQTTGADGSAVFVLPFADADLGKTYTYTLSEINDGRDNIAYSERVYTIEITLSVNADNRIVASAAVDGTPVEQIEAAFENVYNAVILPPLTGDDANLALYAALMLISGAGLAILLTKRYGQALK